MDQTIEDEKYMHRCLQLAANGRQNAKPNPMVGAVIVLWRTDYRRGYHVRCSEGHAEVNAFKSVAEKDGIYFRNLHYMSVSNRAVIMDVPALCRSNCE